VQKAYCRWQAIKKIKMGTTTPAANAIEAASVGGGRYALLNAVDSNGRLNLPWYDLTSVNSVINGSYVGYNPSWQMTISNWTLEASNPQDGYILFNNMVQSSPYPTTSWTGENIGRVYFARDLGSWSTLPHEVYGFEAAGITLSGG
jgi:hypothetical protein